MSTEMGSYDTSGMYATGSHRMQDDAPKMPAPAAEVARMIVAFQDRAAFVATTLRPAASAVAAYAEYLLAAAELPREHQAVLDLLCRQARTILGGLSALAGEDSRGTERADVASGDAAIA